MGEVHEPRSQAVDQLRYRSVTFEPLREEDIRTLYLWLQEPHVREFYHPKPLPSWQEICEKYLQRLDPNWPTRCFLIHVDRAVGYIQTYRVADYPEHAATIGEAEGISIDLFIGDPRYVGIGWGRLILLKFINDVGFPLFSGENVCWIYHDKLNPRALRASKAAGFQYVRDIIEDGGQRELLALRKEESAKLAERMVTG
jgi:aminoglycoside 6'-N-acetyltransferase